MTDANLSELKSSNSNTPQTEVKTHFRACHLCEAICGLEIKTQGDQILSIKGDNKDPFSAGHLCPKAMALKDLHEDDDRIKKPLKKVNGEWQEIGWEQALDEVAQNIVGIQKRHGNNAVGVYAGNPNVHNYGNITHGRLLRKALQTHNNFSATSLDQLPHHLVSYLLYGHQFMLPIPDIDRTDFMLIIGANPLVSNGSIMTVPNVTKRLQSIQKRGGNFTVIDPRKTETAKAANEHLFIKPGTDVYLLLAMVNLVLSQNNESIGHLKDNVLGIEEIKNALAEFTPEIAQKYTGIPATATVELTEKLISTPRALVYGRMGVSVQSHGTLCQWLIQILNIITNHMDSEGGVMLTSPSVAYVTKGAPGAGHFNKFQSRTSKLPEFGGELPVTAMAEDILNPGEGQIKAMFTIAGNPVLSGTNGNQINEAFEQLDYVVAIDFYINETTRHADMILPPPSPLEHEHYDFAFLRLAVRDITRFNEEVFTKADDALHDWEIYNQLSAKICELKGQDFRPMPDPKYLIDSELQNGLYGEKSEHKLSLKTLLDNPHGIDLGPLKTSMKDRIATADGNINLAIDAFIEQLAELPTDSPEQSEALLLIGRRHIRSNNSWMHNAQRLVKGKPHWQLFMHPDDMAARNISDGSEVKVSSRVGSVNTIVKASEDIMPGVISLPHGWGHQRSGVKAKTAIQQEGVSVNDLTDDKLMDAISGNAALNGVPVEVIQVS